MFVPEIDGKEMRMSFIAPPPLLPPLLYCPPSFIAPPNS